MQNIKKSIITLSLMVAISTILSAQPNIDNSEAKHKLKKMADESGVFVKHEVFPRDYFLISKSLPFLVNLTLHHPRSSELGLSKEQISQIVAIKKETTPKVLKLAKEIKKLELSLSDRMIQGAKAKEEFSAIDTIAKKKSDLTKIHVRCIEKVLNVLTPKQKDILLSYAGAKHKKMKHPIEELVELPHPVQFVLMNKKLLKISDKQMARIENEMLAVYPAMIHENMDKAKNIEDSIRKSVLNGGTKESLKKEIDSLVKIKVQITNDHIDALNKLKDILSNKQYKKLLTLIEH